MGVSGLLPLLKSIHKHTTLKAYAGQTLGVDGFGWLHRGAIACASNLALDKPTTQYVSFVVNKVRMLLDFGITPYLVFDGDALPSKAGTNMKRRSERVAAKELGLSLLRSGKKEQAFQEFQKAVTITSQMTHNVIEVLREMNVQVLVAPYEADAQLAYLEQQGIIDGVLSEDSDLLVFGVKKLITKLDQYGSCTEINRVDFVLNKDISFAGWSDTMFRRMAILSGCDYLPSVTKVGLKTAHDYVKKYKDVTRIIRALAFNGKYIIPDGYVSDFQDAERSFLYHRVFCPKAGKLVFLNTLPPGLKEEEMPYLGPYIDSDIAVGVACGDLDPKTKRPFTNSAITSSRVSLQENRRQTMNGSTDLKSKRSIDNFFKPHRTPLAELDPNSLTPSPSQQRVLERNRNASWEPRPVSSAPQLRRSITDISFVPRSNLHTQSSTPNQLDRCAFLVRAAATSTYKPAKRIRLCSESDEVSPSKEIKQSRFFSPSTFQNSPLTNKKRRERAAKAQFDVFSDDSIEGLMLELEHQTQEQVSKDILYPSLPILPDHEPELEHVELVPQSSPRKAQEVHVDSQSSHGTAELNDISLASQEHDIVEVMEVNQVDDAEAFVDLLEFHVSKLNEETRAQTTTKSRTFSHQSPERQAIALASLNKATVQQSTATIAQAAEEDIDIEAEEIASPQHRKAKSFQALARTFALQSPLLQSRALGSLGKTPVPKIKPISNIQHRTSTEELKGSEDALALIRSSDNEEELSEVDGERRHSVRKFDIKNFSYTT